MMFKDEWKGWLLIVLGPFALALVLAVLVMFWPR
jgi:hypothetical protein